MFEVIEVFQIGDMLSITLNGNCEKLNNNSKVIDAHNNIYQIISIAMRENDNPSDISKTTTVLLPLCNLRKGDTLDILLT